MVLSKKLLGRYLKIAENEIILEPWRIFPLEIVLEYGRLISIPSLDIMRKFNNVQLFVNWGIFCASWSSLILGSGMKSRSLTFTKEVMFCSKTMIKHVSNTEIAILLLFRARISENLPLIGPTGKSGLMTVSDNNNHMDNVICEQIWMQMPF